MGYDKPALRLRGSRAHTRSEKSGSQRWDRRSGRSTIRQPDEQVKRRALSAAVADDNTSSITVVTTSHFSSLTRRVT